jgi:hypothetical protein
MKKQTSKQSGEVTVTLNRAEMKAAMECAVRATLIHIMETVDMWKLKELPPQLAELALEAWEREAV